MIHSSNILMGLYARNLLKIKITFLFLTLTWLKGEALAPLVAPLF